MQSVEMKILTPSLICRQFVMLLSHSFGPIKFSEEPQSFITGQKQMHVEVLIEPDELRGSLEDLSERTLLPCAQALASSLKRAGAMVTFHLGLPEHGKRPTLHCSTHQRGGMSVRCLMDEPSYSVNLSLAEQGKWITRFDVLYRDPEVQAAI